jgi:hypothetical protein
MFGSEKLTQSGNRNGLGRVGSEISSWLRPFVTPGHSESKNLTQSRKAAKKSRENSIEFFESHESTESLSSLCEFSSLRLCGFA